MRLVGLGVVGTQEGKSKKKKKIKKKKKKRKRKVLEEKNFETHPPSLRGGIWEF